MTSKGGVWTNVEDEILKAAISKYGKNQWARISSLLVRKTDKQCKARWYEWLDPSIKKIEWTRDEDEKLLHAARVHANQWRTIAFIVDRTSTQCLERYSKLLDDAEAAENNEFSLSGPGAEASAPTADSVRRLRAGEIDPDPETKPAKPDSIDMDEDEKEMLSEARARLANTQGKKAKRKQREKLIAETKRLSVIQKRRDLKAAGINTKLYFRKKGEMDYNADIPFEHKPALGFYDTTEESQANERERLSVDFRQIEQKRRDEASAAEERKAAMKKRGNDVSNDATSQAGSLEKLRKEEQLLKRRKLNLPAPQVTDQELAEVVKSHRSFNKARELALTEDENAASQALLGEYSTVVNNQLVRTPRTPAAQDNIALEARNLRALSSVQSSLLGGQNTPLHGGQHRAGDGGMTPKIGTAVTPSPLAAAAIPLRTPRRDNLSLNATTESEVDSSQLVVHDELRLAKQRAAQLRSQFASLPAPKNDFELQLLEEAEELTIRTNETDEDAAQRDSRLQLQRQVAAEMAAKKRSSVIQKGLPRPKDLHKLRTVPKQTETPETLISEELTRLIASDNARYPIDGSRSDKSAAAVVDDLDLDKVTEIRALIAEEAKKTAGGGDADTTNFEDGASTADHHVNTDITRLLPALNARLREDAHKSAKFEKKMSLVLGGYANRSKMLTAKFNEATAALQKAYIDRDTFEFLQTNEDAAMVARVDILKEEVNVLERHRGTGQLRYSALTARKDELMNNMMN